MSAEEPQGQKPKRRDPLHIVLDALPVEALDATLDVAGRGAEAAGSVLGAGARLAADAAGELLERAGGLAGEAAQAGLDAASSVDFGDVADVMGDVAGAVGEGLGEVAGAVVEGLGNIS